MSELVKIELTEEALQRIIDHTKVHINSTVDDVVDEKLPSAVATKMDKQNPSGTGDMHITGDYYDGTGSIVGASNKLYTIEIIAEKIGTEYTCTINRTFDEILNNFNADNIILVHLTDITTGYEAISTNVFYNVHYNTLFFEITEEWGPTSLRKFLVELWSNDYINKCELLDVALSLS